MNILNSKTRAIFAILFVALITICSILIVQKIVKHVRIDLTDNTIYTLSQGTRNIVSKVDQPLHIKLYYGHTASMKAPEGIRAFNNYYVYLKDLLEEYVDISGGKITLEVIDPRPYSEQEEEAIKAGIKNFPLTEEETFFFGLTVATETGKEEVIPFFTPERQAIVEYDISKAISNVTTTEKKRIGVLSSLKVMGGDTSPQMQQMMQAQGREQGPWMLIKQLQQEYDVITVPTDLEAIAEDPDFLFVIHPKDLPEKTLFAIDQYVMRGGKLLVFMDPYSFMDQPEQDPNNPYLTNDNYKSSSNLSSLLKKWGVEMKDDEFAADFGLAISRPVQRGQRPMPIVTFLEIGENNVNKKEVIAAELKSMQMLFCGILKKVDVPGINVYPLITTTNKANVWKPESPTEIQYPDAEKMLSKFTDGKESFMLACRIEGTFKTNFPDGIKTDDGKTTTPAFQESSDAMVIVVSDVDMLSDMLAYQNSFFGVSQIGDNASLALNSLDYLRGSKDLISVRSRTKIDRPFDVVDEIEKQAEKDTSKQVAEINAKIEEYDKKLQELGTGASQSQEEAKLVESEVIKERKKIEEEMRMARKQLRQVNAGKLQKIEALGDKIQTINMLAAPIVVLIIAIVLALLRYVKAKRYVIARRENQ